ncbi:hypothetical protein P7C73_g3725, partial [Tremellales sp. Uapishka_1]
MSRTLLVTVGSTLFPALTDAVLSPAVLAALPKLGVKRLVVQYGHGDLPPYTQNDGLEVETMRFTNEYDQLVSESHVVISHAGAGSILSVLRKRPRIRLIVVPNTSLMDNHQAELADVLGDEGFLTVAAVDRLEDALKATLRDDFFETHKEFPLVDQTNFPRIVDGLMGYA